MDRMLDTLDALVAEWFFEGSERLMRACESLLDGADDDDTRIYAIAGLLRDARRRRDENTATRARYDEILDRARSALAPEEVSALKHEAESLLGADAATAWRWYREPPRTGSERIRAHWARQAAVLCWCAEGASERGRQLLSDVVDGPEAAEWGGGLGRMLLALASREQGLAASCERDLHELMRQEHHETLARWGRHRYLLHMALVQGCPGDVHDMLRRADERAAYPELSLLFELLGRALRREEALETLLVHGDGAAAAACALEAAELADDEQTLFELAGEGYISALVPAEVLVARGAPDYVPSYNLEWRFRQMRRSLRQDPQHVVRRRFAAYVEDIDASLYGTPWGPWALLDHDLARLGLSGPSLTSLARLVESTAEDDPMCAEARLIVARQLVRAGQRDAALRLLPERHGRTLVDRAWYLLQAGLDGGSGHEHTRVWEMSRWEHLVDTAPSPSPLYLYEYGRCLETDDQPERAAAAHHRAIEAREDFVWSHVAAGRLAIRLRDWRGLAELWRREYEGSEEMASRSSLAFRLGHLYERRLGAEEPDARHIALDFYTEVLSSRPNHLPSLQAALELGYRLERYDVVTRCLEQFARLAADRTLRLSYLVELGHIEETQTLDAEAARSHYEQAFALAPDHLDAFWGLVRTDAHDGRATVRAIGERLAHTLAPDEERTMGDLLFALGARHDGAAFVLQERFPRHALWQFHQMLESIARGDIAPESLTQLRECMREDSIRRLLSRIEQLARADWEMTFDDVESLLPQIGVAPMSEGMLVRALQRAWSTRDTSALALLAVATARRATDELSRAAELTWMAMVHHWSGQTAEALRTCERLLEHFPDFLPAIKLAKLLCEALPAWSKLARWYSREASITRVEALATLDRVNASRVQQRHLGDVEAASAQLRHVLREDPGHDEAFEQLKALLLQRGEIGAILSLIEHRLEHPIETSRRVELLDEMADLALSHLQDPRVAIDALSRSLQIDPQQLRQLRILGDLYESIGAPERAVTCLESALQLTEDPKLSRRMLLKLGAIFEEELDAFEEAREAFERALAIDDDCIVAREAIARLSRALGDIDRAAVTYRHLEARARRPDVLRRARTGLLDLLVEHDAPENLILESARTVLTYHPKHLDATRAVCQIFAARLDREGREVFFRELLHDAMNALPRLPMSDFVEVARQADLPDLAFHLAAVARWLGADDESTRTRHEAARAERLWPNGPLPPDLTRGMLPEELTVAFIEMLRRSEQGLREACDRLPFAQHLRRRSRLSEPTSEKMSLAFRWPEIFGLELRDVHLVDRLPFGSAVLYENGIRLLLDRRWEGEGDPTEWLVPLGNQLAAWSMGIGMWSYFDRDVQRHLATRTIAAVVSSWGTPPEAEWPGWFHLDRYQRWLDRGDTPFAAYALELSGRMAPTSLLSQFRLIDLAMDRLGCTLLDDPYRYLPVAPQLGVDRGQRQRPWTFLFSAQARRLRAALGMVRTSF
jgi:tetratricopeptide (TPR) repeat protein